MKRVTVLAVGSKLTGWAREAEREYCRRMGDWQAQVITVRPGQGTKAQEKEAKSLLRRIPSGSTPVACVAGDDCPSSVEFARRFPAWLGNGGVTFLIGNHHGLHPSLLERVRERLSLSRLTLAQDLARIVLLEQCYRSMCILAGHPYHTQEKAA